MTTIHCRPFSFDPGAPSPRKFCVALLLALLAPGPALMRAAPAPCESLVSLQLPNGKITGAVDTVIGAVGSVADSVGSFFGMAEDEDAPGAGGGGRPSLLPPPQSFPRLFAPTPAPPAEARVTVDFANAPRGTRVSQDSGSTADVDLSVGYQMGLMR